MQEKQKGKTRTACYLLYLSVKITCPNIFIPTNTPTTLHLQVDLAKISSRRQLEREKEEEWNMSTLKRDERDAF